jgi:hypothetical protein
MSVDYFGRYLTSQGFDLPALINDDFIAPIRLLFQNRYYVSAAKLLMTFIDSLGYLEYGDGEQIPFIKWLSNYVDLATIGVSAEELWEHRNSLLHMSNLDSRKVVAGKTRRLMFYVGTLPTGVPSETVDARYYSLQNLVYAIIKGCERWLASYNEDRSKIASFVRRYDLIVSDNRMLSINTTNVVPDS